MKNLRWILPSLALVLLAPGCILTSGQILIDFDLPSITATSSTGLIGEQIDLTQNDDYEKHKDKLKDIADFAVLGTFRNTGATDVDVEVWLTRDLTILSTATAVQGAGIKLWGPLHVPSGGTVSIDWDGSAKLFTTAGKEAVLQEAKGDGSFTLYALGAAGTYQFDVDNGVLAIVIDVGM
jgi:hypothetical protein